MQKPLKGNFQFTKLTKVDDKTEVLFDIYVEKADESHRIDKGKERTVKPPHDKLLRLLKEETILEALAFYCRTTTGNVKVLGVVVSDVGKKEKNRGFNIIGYLKTPTGAEMKVITPFTKFDDVVAYDKVNEVKNRIDEINDEVYGFLFEGLEGDHVMAFDEVEVKGEEMTEEMEQPV